MAPRRKSNPRKFVSPAPPIHHLHAAGIDVGAREIYVAVPPGSDPRPVRTFDTFTEDLLALRDWLIECGVTTVALESTGVYWIPLFQILESAGLEVVAGQCASLQEPARTQDRCAGLPVAPIPPLRGTLARELPSR